MGSFRGSPGRNREHPSLLLYEKCPESWGTGARLPNQEEAEPARKTGADTPPCSITHLSVFFHLPTLLCKRGSSSSERLSNFPEIPQQARRLTARSQVNQLSVQCSFQYTRENHTRGGKSTLGSHPLFHGNPPPPFSTFSPWRAFMSSFFPFNFVYLIFHLSRFLSRFIFHSTNHI